MTHAYTNVDQANDTLDYASDTSDAPDNTSDHTDDNVIEIDGHDLSHENAPSVDSANQGIDYQAQAEKFKDQWMRTAADLDNLRKRAAKERDDALKYGVTKFATDMLGVADNMQRALESLPENFPEDLKGLIEGIQLTQGSLNNALDKHHIKTIHPMGEVFNPNFHQAMFDIPAAPGMTPGTVAQVLQNGYMIHDRLLRPALVGVVKGVAQPDQNMNQDSKEDGLASGISIDA